MANVTFDKKQIERAKQEQKALVCVYVGGQHIKGAKHGRAMYHYLATPEQAEEAYELLTRHFKDNCNKGGQ